MNDTFRISLAFFFLLSLAACSKYQRNTLPMNRLGKVDKVGLNYYLVDAAHPLTRVWNMSNCKIGDQELHCYLTKMSETKAVEVSLIRGNWDARASKNDVLFYADTKFAATIQDTCSININTGQLEKIEVLELNHLRSYGVPLLSLTGFLTLLFLIGE